MSILDKFKKKAESPEKASVAKKVSSKEESTKPVKKSAVKEKTETTKKKSVGSVSKLATSTFLKPVVTEKTARLADNNVVTFFVPTTANRITVRQAFRELYKVTPVKVNIVNSRGKAVRFGRVQGKRNNTKKALITLPKGTSVDIFEGV